MSDLDRYFYSQEQTCPVCGQKFPVTKVRKSMCAVERRDSDLYNHCSPVDPTQYTVLVCSHCGYAASDASFTELTPAEKALLTKALAGRSPIADLTGQRDHAAARAAMEQALFCAQARHAKPSVLAGLYLRTAWVLRSAGDPQEAEYLGKALENYRQAYQSEPLPLGKMSELTLTYLIGELARRAGNLNEAVNWFYQVVNSPDGAKEPQILNMAREQWRLTREQAEAAQGRSSQAGAPAQTAAPAVTSPVAHSDGEEEAAPAAAAPTTAAPQPAEAPVPAPPAKVPTALSLYRDQVDWARRVANLCAGKNPRLDLAAVVRASLQLVQDLDPTELVAEDEDSLTERLRAALARS